MHPADADSRGRTAHSPTSPGRFRPTAAAPPRPAAIAWTWYAGNAALLALLGLVPVWIRTALHLYHNYDLGIFAQALHSIRPGDLNPFLPALDLRLFCDHFDPILVLVAPLGWLLEPAFAALAVEHALVLLAPLPILLLCRKNPEDTPFACLATTYLLFNRGILSALAFPVHPTTWAAFFVVAVGVCAIARRWAWLALAAILLMACKEEFPFAVLMLGLALGGQRRFRIAAVLVGLAAGWLILAFGVRPWLLGATHGYASRVLSPLLADPVATVWERLRGLGEAKRLFQCLVPLLPAGLWLGWRRTPLHWPILVAALPLLAIRFLDGAWRFHYLAPVAPLFLLALWRPKATRLPWGCAVLGILITFLSSGNPLRKGVSAYAAIPELRGARRMAIEQARAHLLDRPEGRALVEGNLVPLLARRADVFQIGGVQPAQPYRFFLAEKPPCGDPWPLAHSDIERITDEWRTDARATVLQDDAHVFLAERKPEPEKTPDAAADNHEE